MRTSCWLKGPRPGAWHPGPRAWAHKPKVNSHETLKKCTKNALCEHLLLVDEFGPRGLASRAPERGLISQQEVLTQRIFCAFFQCFVRVHFCLVSPRSGTRMQPLGARTLKPARSFHTTSSNAKIFREFSHFSVLRERSFLLMSPRSGALDARPQGANHAGALWGGSRSAGVERERSWLAPARQGPSGSALGSLLGEAEFAKKCLWASSSPNWSFLCLKTTVLGIFLPSTFLAIFGVSRGGTPKLVGRLIRSRILGKNAPGHVP